ncbi:MAG TPA: hypothetical protein PK687_07125 [Candidatus Avimonas sp.]|nr:hypothetical protein [Candidatus Avimonas sp.]
MIYALLSAIIILLSIIMALSAFWTGLYFGRESILKSNKNAQNRRTEENKPIREPTEEEKRQALIRQLEMQNFFNYWGDPMPDPKDEAIKLLNQSQKG